MENKEQKNDLLKGFQKIMEKSIEANTQIMKATSETFTNLVSKQPDWSDLQKLNSDVLNSTISNFMEINLKYAESLIDLGVQLSNDVSNFVESLDKKENAEVIVEEKVKATQQKSELRLSGQRGETIVANFELNNSAETEQKGTFKASRCIADDTGKLTNIRLKFSPKSFKIAPGGKVEIEISASIPKSAKAGSYRSNVSIKGFDNTQFDVIVYVEEKTVK